MKKIGKRKYEALSSFDFDNLTEIDLELFNESFSITISEAIKMMQSYEKDNQIGEINQSEIAKEYFNNLGNIKSTKKIIENPKEYLWKEFIKCYFKNEGVSYSRDENSIENLKPLIYYFIGDYDNFIKCKNLSTKSKPSLSKGLLIIGTYGNGKTSVMRAFEKALYTFPKLRFKTYSTNNIVKMYESCSSPTDKNEFNKLFNSGILFFDDMLTERLASNYGTANIIKDIIEERSLKNKKTFITCNYKDNTNNDLGIGLSQFGEKYGSRIYDRLFSDYNIIEFKGKSRRI